MMCLNLNVRFIRGFVLITVLIAVSNLGGWAQSVLPEEADSALTHVFGDEDSRRADSLKSPADVDYLQRPLPARDFDPSDWEKTTQGLKYPIQWDPERKQPPVEKNKKISPFLLALLGALGVLLKFIVYVGFGGGILYLLARFLMGGNIFAGRSRKIKHSDALIELTEIEENLPDADLDEYIRQALAQKNYILAVRLYHLAMIRELSASGVVEWKKDKTNRAYLQEMRNNGLYEPFRRATRIFEKVWYGNTAFGETDFAVVQPDLQGLLTRIRQKA